MVMSLQSNGENLFFTPNPGAEQHPPQIEPGAVTPADPSEVYVGAAWAVNAALPVDDDPEIEERVLKALVLSLCNDQGSNPPIQEKTTTGDAKTSGSEDTGPSLELLKRVLKGLKGLDGGSAQSEADETEVSEPEPNEPKEDKAEVSFPGMVLPTFDEKPLFSPAETQIVSDIVPSVRPARPEPPVRPSKILEAVVGPVAPGWAAADPSEITTVIADQSAAPYIPPLQIPAETTLVFGDDSGHTHFEGYSDPDYVEPLPQLTEHVDHGQQSGVWILPEHVMPGQSAVVDTIHGLPSESLPGPTDVESILGTPNIGSYHIGPQ